MGSPAAVTAGFFLLRFLPGRLLIYPLGSPAESFLVGTVDQLLHLLGGQLPALRDLGHDVQDDHSQRHDLREQHLGTSARSLPGSSPPSFLVMV
ncbi:MAG TPA: hypothetical protein VEV41_01025 [Terriglobales bacterium]|nr:hypothetical protein [Terriglobales bacterium]